MCAMSMGLGFLFILLTLFGVTFFVPVSMDAEPVQNVRPVEPVGIGALDQMPSGWHATQVIAGGAMLPQP